MMIRSFECILSKTHSELCFCPKCINMAEVIRGSIHFLSKLHRVKNNLSGFETNVPILWKLDGLRRGVMRMFRECFLMPKKHRKNMQRSEKIIQYCMLIFWFCINNLFFSHIYPNLR